MIAVYKVTDIAAAEKHLTERGLKPIAKFERGQSKEVIFSPEGAHGMCIVINEYPDVSAVGIEAAKYFAELKKQQEVK